jgi:hypothetical protein
MLEVAMRYRHCIGAAMTLAVMGYHLQVMTSRLSKAIQFPAVPPSPENDLSRESIPG